MSSAPGPEPSIADAIQELETLIYREPQLERNLNFLKQIFQSLQRRNLETLNSKENRIRQLESQMMEIEKSLRYKQAEVDRAEGDRRYRAYSTADFNQQETKLKQSNEDKDMYHSLWLGAQQEIQGLARDFAQRESFLKSEIEVTNDEAVSQIKINMDLNIDVLTYQEQEKMTQASMEAIRRENDMLRRRLEANEGGSSMPASQ